MLVPVRPSVPPRSENCAAEAEARHTRHVVADRLAAGDRRSRRSDGWPAKPCAHTAAVDRIDVDAVLSLPKIAVDVVVRGQEAAHLERTPAAAQADERVAAGELAAVRSGRTDRAVLDLENRIEAAAERLRAAQAEARRVRR